jgi:hypothetical protein
MVTLIADLARLILGSARAADLKQIRQFGALESDEWHILTAANEGVVRRP